MQKAVKLKTVHLFCLQFLMW